MKERGFGMVEALVALAILGIVLTGLVPSFYVFLNSNTLNDQRSGALAAGQRVLEDLRHQDPGSLPTSGTGPLQLVAVGTREYEVTTRFCVQPGFCNAESRHLIVEVAYGGRQVVSLETVQTRLR